MSEQSFPHFPFQSQPKETVPQAQPEQLQTPFEPQAMQRKRGRPATRAKNGGQRGRPRKNKQPSTGGFQVSSYHTAPVSETAPVGGPNALKALDSVLQTLQPLSRQDRNTVLSLVSRFHA